jgi:hypothetical protein
MARRKYQELFSTTGHFTSITQTSLERAVGKALLGRKTAIFTLRRAVYRATRELRVYGLTDGAILAVLGGLVEDAGRAGRADRTSLLSGEPAWMPVRTTVLEFAQHELAELLVNEHQRSYGNDRVQPRDILIAKPDASVAN